MDRSLHTKFKKLMAENFRWAINGAPPSVTTEQFILSDNERPRLADVQSSEHGPLEVIDLGGHVSDDELAKQVARASEEVGMFKIINHGIPQEVWERAAQSVTDFFLLPPEVKKLFAGEGGAIDIVKVYSYFLFDWDDKRKVYMWSEVLNHLWHPTADFAAGFPHDQIPASYREHVVAYARQMGVLMTRLLRLLSKGLGLEQGYLEERLGKQPLYKCHGNYYPLCPDPSLTIGLPIHSDSLALSVVRTLDSVPGLQILKGDNWVAVDDQLPDSFTINIGDQLEVLSNGRYKSVLHRVVTNESSTRVSLAHFWGPGLDQTIGPIEELVDDQHPLMYKTYVYKEFIEEHNKLAGQRRDVKKLFRLNPSPELGFTN